MWSNSGILSLLLHRLALVLLGLEDQLFEFSGGLASAIRTQSRQGAHEEHRSALPGIVQTQCGVSSKLHGEFMKLL
jgi:hypothetical protein